jgi:hypothetical protein
MFRAFALGAYTLNVIGLSVVRNRDPNGLMCTSIVRHAVSNTGEDCPL